MPACARLVGVEKWFGSVRALAGADLTLEAGRIHGVLGENGAGKSTLLGILGGLIAPDSGTIEIEGAAVRLGSPGDAWTRGVGLVHQHFALVPTFTVLENLSLGRRGGSRVGRLDLRRVRERVQALSERTGLSVTLDAPVSSLGVGERQRVEILKALLRDPKILVLDEPTAVLAPSEVERLFDLLRDLASSGTSVALVAHKLDEVLAVAQDFTVLREGRTVLKGSRAEVDAVSLTRAMIGGDEGAARPGITRKVVQPVRTSGDAVPSEVVASLVDVSTRDEAGGLFLRGVGLEVRRGELVGIAGVGGNGQRELALILAGRRRPDAGVAHLPDEVAFIPQDRIGQGLIADFSLVENAALTLQRSSAFRTGPILRWGAIRSAARDLIREYDVRASGASVPARSLSGGNQQRLVVARELRVARDLLVAENPTRGLDVMSAAFVHASIRARVLEGDAATRPGMVLISTDLDEILALATRILVISRGRLSPVAPDLHTREGVGTLMVGGSSA